MSGTTYVNGSGLPAEEQITTARDQALLGLIIHNRFPNYYTYFSTLSFNYHGREMHNHNGLLGNVRGVDGIKTGYTEASGYNLVASVSRDDRHIVAVVLGGTSNGQRDNLMRKLIEEHILRASAQRTAPPITEGEPGLRRASRQSDQAGPAPPLQPPRFRVASVRSKEAETRGSETALARRRAGSSSNHRAGLRSPSQPRYVPRIMGARPAVTDKRRHTA
jgi:D-alanyl-D-alanine carboxypeptidase